jgi:hypothetical protein
MQSFTSLYNPNLQRDATGDSQRQRRRVRGERERSEGERSEGEMSERVCAHRIPTTTSAATTPPPEAMAHSVGVSGACTMLIRLLVVPSARRLQAASQEACVSSAIIY